MNLKKLGIIAAGILVGGLLLIILTLLFWLGPTVKVIAQTVGIKALGTSLSIEKLSINPLKGTIHLSDFSIANHDSYAKSNAVSLASLDIAIDMSSLFTRTVVVHQVSLNSPHFIYEQDDASDNITEFVLNIQKFAGIGPDAPPKKEKKKKKKQKKSNKEPKIVMIEALEINDVQIHMDHTGNDLLDIGVGFEHLSISMTKGMVQLDDLYIRNPGRLTSPNLFTLDRIAIELEPETIYTSNITINAVQITNPQAYIEHNPETDTIGEFLKIANRIVDHIPEKNTETNTVEIVEAEEAPPSEVILKMLAVEGIRLHVVNIGDPQLDVHFGIDAIRVALDPGKVSVDNIHVTNPKRLTLPNVFALETITVDFTPESLKANTLVINDVQILKPYAFLELNKEANTVGEFTKIAHGFTSRIPTYPLPEKSGTEVVLSDNPVTAEEDAAPSAPPFELHNLLVDDIEIRLLDTIPTNDVPTESRMLAGIGSVSVKLVDGNIQIKGITIPNMAGFNATNIFHLANIDISIEPDSVHSEQVIINTIFINSPEINLEQTETSGNVSDMQTTLSGFAPAPSVTAASTNQVEATAATTKTPIPIAEQPVVLHSLIVTNFAVNMILPASTNEASGPIRNMELSILNPMQHIGHSDTNIVADIDEDKRPLKLITFDQLSLEPLKGLLYINNMQIANPRGFANKHLVKIEQFRIDLDPDTLQSDILVIEDILIDNPRVSYERKIMTDNIKTLQDEIEKAAMRRGEITAKEETPKPEAAEDDAGGQKVVIEHLLVQNGIVRAKISALPTAPIPLPDIEMTDLGKEEGGTSLGDAGSRLYTAFYDAIIGSVSSATGFAGDALKGAGAFTFGALENMTDRVTGGLDSMVNRTEEAAADVVEKLKEPRKKRRGPAGRRSAIK
ncbi:MAG: hypothetical protein V3V05_11000 [Pontiella sp.]